MTDQDLRTLERQFKQTGSAEDERAYLLALVRAGEALEWGSTERVARGIGSILEDSMPPLS